MKAKGWILVVVAQIVLCECVLTASPRLASGNALLSRTAAGNSFAPQLSANGRYVVFASHAKNLTTNQFSGLALNIFRRDLISGETLLISTDLNGNTGGNENSAFYSVSWDGRYIAFASSAGNLVANDTNLAADIFLWDELSRTNRLVTRTNAVSYDMNGVPSGTPTPLDNSPNSLVPLSSNPQISADGRWVVFESRSSNLVAVTDAPNTVDVFAHDVVSNKTFLVSITTAGTAAIEANSSSHSPRLTPDGRFVLFVSSVTDLVGGAAPSGKSHLFLRDLQSSSTKWITKDLETALEWNSNAYDIVEHTLSDNAQVIAFKVNARGSSPASVIVFRYNVQTESLLSLGSNSYLSSPPQLSADGRFLAYEEGPNVLIWDEVFHTNFVVNLDSSNSHASGGVSHTPVLAADGRSIAFLSSAGDLVPGVSGGQFQVFWRDLIERITILVSAATNGQPASPNHELVMPAISADGFTVAFESSAADLIADDLNHAVDVFAFDLLSDPPLSCPSVAEPTKPSVTGPGAMGISRNCASADGRVVAFFGYDSSLFRDDTNLVTDLFVHDIAAGTNVMISLGTNSLFDPELSADGRYVTYTRRIQITSFSYHDDIFRHDLATKANVLVNRSSSGGASTGNASAHSMSSDGRYVAFESTATDLDPRDVSTDSDIYVHDFALGSNFLISSNVPGDSFGPRFAPDDQHLFFLSQSELFVTAMGSANAPLLVSHDPQTATSPLPSARSFSVSGNSRRVVFDTSDNSTRILYRNDLASNSVSAVCTNCQNGSLNGDGRWLAYEFYDPQASPFFRGVYLYDFTTGESKFLSSAEQLGSADLNDSSSPIISGDGRFVVFLSRVHSPLSPARLYVYDRSLDQVMLLTPSPEGIGLVSGPGAQLQIARDGRTVFFRSFSDLVEDDYNDKRDVFVLRLGAGDSDGDGMDDDWEMASFSTLDRDGFGDFDGDGQTNLEEFRAGTDATNNGSMFRALTVTRIGGTTTIFWHGNPSRSYRVEFKASVDDSSWSPVAGEVRFSGTTAYLLDQRNSDQGFYRVVVLP